MSDKTIDHGDETQRAEDELLEEQRGHGYGADEGERDPEAPADARTETDEDAA